MYRPKRKRQERRAEDSERMINGKMTAAEMDSVLDVMLRGVSVTETRQGRVLGQQQPFRSPEDVQNAFADYIAYLREQNKRGIRVIPDVEGFCSYVGISRGKWLELGKKSTFREIFNNCQTAISYALKQKGMTGDIPPVVLAITLNNNHGYVSDTKQLKIEQNTPKTDTLPSVEDVLKSLPVKPGKQAEN